MPDKSFKIETAASRVLLLAAGLACLTAVFFFAKWCFANAIATRAPQIEVAELSVAMAPNDPQTHYAAAILKEKSFLLEDLPKALAEFEQATALSPNDYRLWLAYGKALERNGDAAAAELALKKASEIAPNYAPVQWSLGNILLRRGRTAEGFGEMRRAAESDQTFRLPAIATAWQIFDGSLGAVRQSLGDSANLTAALAVFLTEQKRFEEAFETWDALPAADRKTVYKTEGEELFRQLIAAKKYRRALRVQNDLNDQPAAEKFAVGAIYNGGFEAEISREKANMFDWQIADGAQPLIGPNNEQKRGGDRSIFIVFNSPDGKDFRQISQTAAVESAKKYTLEGFYKSNLKTTATLRWEVSDAADGKLLAASDPIAASADWTNFAVAFAAAATTEAVTLRLVRESCKASLCPISGSVWFDDFSLRQ